MPKLRVKSDSIRLNEGDGTRCREVARERESTVMEAASQPPRPRKRPTVVQPALDDLSGGAVLAIVKHIDTRIDGLEGKFDTKLEGLRSEILTKLDDGRKAHTLEHSQQQTACSAAMGPLQARYNQESDASTRRKARTEPIVKGASWVSNHWVFSGAIGAGVVGILVRLGIVKP